MIAIQRATGTGPMGVGRGVDFAFEVVGGTKTLRQTIDITRRGGTAVQVGVPRMTDHMNFVPFMDLFVGIKTIRGSFYGDAFRDMPMLVDLYKQGRLKLDELVSRRIDLSDVNKAFAAMAAGEVARSVIVYD